MSSSQDFYTQLGSFTSFGEVADERHYARLPDDWNVIITDVKGSTQAIANDRYKEVNMAGAATITAVLNALGRKKIPFVFGGDGATFLAHSSDQEKISEALAKTCAMTMKNYDLELRVGWVSAKELARANARVDVAKFQVSKQAELAMIRGGGVNIAEKWIKGGDPRAVSVPPATGDADLAGLSCRWNPIPAKKGEMLSILILARVESSRHTEIYSMILREIEKILGTDDASNPVTADKLDRRVSMKAILRETRLKGSPLSYTLKMYVAAIGLRVLAGRGWMVGNFDSRKYVRDLVSNTDFRKFDDMLRMVRDCSTEQKLSLTAFFEKLHADGLIYYGVHASKEALMTCMAFSSEDHVHFIDGGGGGYALAAKQMKGQMAAAPKAQAI